MDPHPDSSTEFDSSSCSRSAASPDGDSPCCRQPAPPDSLSANSTEDTESSGEDSRVQTVQISTSSALRCVQLQSTFITSVRPFSGRAKTRPHGANKSSSPAAANKTKPSNNKGAKGIKPSKVEEERRTLRRERNKIAAAKCRNRRRELIDTLQAETDKLEDDKSALQTEIDNLLREKERLEQLLEAHKPSCKLSTSDGDDDGERRDDGDTLMQQDSPGPLQLLSILEEDAKAPQSAATMGEAPVGQEADCVARIPAAAILGNSNIFLCSSADGEALEDLKGDDLDDLVPSLEMAVTSEMAASVPDIDLSGSFGLSDWDTLYKSVANDLESLSTPVMSSSPTCSNYRTAFSFNCSEVDFLTEGFESLKGSLGLNSPTLLVL